MPREGVSNQRVCNNHCVTPPVYICTERSKVMEDGSMVVPHPAFHRAKVMFPGI